MGTVSLEHVLAEVQRLSQAEQQQLRNTLEHWLQHDWPEDCLEEVLSLRAAPCPSPAGRGHGSPWMRTLLSFTVPNVEEVTRRLLASGVQTCGPADAFRDAKGHIRTVFFRDPDGILGQFDEGGEG